MEQPFERGITCSDGSIDHEATTSIGGGSSQNASKPLPETTGREEANKEIVMKEFEFVGDEQEEEEYGFDDNTCPNCGADVSNFQKVNNGWECPECGEIYFDDEAGPENIVEAKASSLKEFKVQKQGSKWVVVGHKGDIKGTHNTKEQAEAQVKAIYAQQSQKESLKSYLRQIEKAYVMAKHLSEKGYSVHKIQEYLQQQFPELDEDSIGDVIVACKKM